MSLRTGHGPSHWRSRTTDRSLGDRISGERRSAGEHAEESGHRSGVAVSVRGGELGPTPPVGVDVIEPIGAGEGGHRIGHRLGHPADGRGRNPEVEVHVVMGGDLLPETVAHRLPGHPPHHLSEQVPLGEGVIGEHRTRCRGRSLRRQPPAAGIPVEHDVATERGDELVEPGSGEGVPDPHLVLAGRRELRHTDAIGDSMSSAPRSRSISTTRAATVLVVDQVDDGVKLPRPGAVGGARPTHRSATTRPSYTTARRGRRPRRRSPWRSRTLEPGSAVPRPRPRSPAEEIEERPGDEFGTLDEDRMAHLGKDHEFTVGQRGVDVFVEAGLHPGSFSPVSTRHGTVTEPRRYLGPATRRTPTGTRRPACPAPARCDRR